MAEEEEPAADAELLALEIKAVLACLAPAIKRGHVGPVVEVLTQACEGNWPQRVRDLGLRLDKCCTLIGQLEEENHYAGELAEAAEEDERERIEKRIKQLCDDLSIDYVTNDDLENLLIKIHASISPRG